jgi:hypothetical protein
LVGLDQKGGKDPVVQNTNKNGEGTNLGINRIKTVVDGQYALTEHTAHFSLLQTDHQALEIMQIAQFWVPNLPADFSISR